jgi:hypothetical protein
VRTPAGVPGTPQGGAASGNSSPVGGPTARVSGGGGGFTSSLPADADSIVKRAADLLLVMAHADTATKVLCS